MAAKKTKAGKNGTKISTCEKCGHVGPLVGVNGDVCGDSKCSYCGKHIGECFDCGFSLLSDRNEKCPRCHGKITKCRKCGVSIESGNTCARCA